MTAAERSTNPMPRWQAIRDELITQLPSYAYGDRFLSITDICGRFDVSTITARRVLSELQNLGLVEKVRSRGTVVRRLAKTTRVRLVMPAGIRRDYATHSVVVRRTLVGITDFAQQHKVEFDTISESHVQPVFAQRNDTFGLLLLPQVAATTIRFLRSRSLPHVSLNPHKRWKGVPYAMADRRAAGYLGARHLIALGHTRIAYVLGPIAQRHFRERLSGYRVALREAGVAFRWSLVKETGGEISEQDDHAVAELMTQPSPPTAIMAGDDGRAIQIVETLRRRGIDVPGDVSVVGYPNYPETKLIQPSLTVVDACYEQVGLAAMRLLLNLMYEQGRCTTSNVTIPPTLVKRGSTAPPEGV